MTENLSGSSAETAPVEQPLSGGSGTEAEAAAAPRRRPARRTAKLDPVLAAAVDRAREGVLEIAPAEQIGAHVGSQADGDRLVTHRFEAKLAGYAGWQWFATLARVPRGKEATVCEVGLLPSEQSLLAPEWVPWADRVRPEEVAAAAEAEAAAAAEAQGDDEAAANQVQGNDGEGNAAAEAHDETEAADGLASTADEHAPATAGEDAVAAGIPATGREDEAADAAADENLTEAADIEPTEDFTEATS